MSKPLWNHSVQHQSFGLSAGFAALPLPLLMRGSQDGHEMGSGEAIGPESSAAPKSCACAWRFFDAWPVLVYCFVVLQACNKLV